MTPLERQVCRLLFSLNLLLLIALPHLGKSLFSSYLLTRFIKMSNVEQQRQLISQYPELTVQSHGLNWHHLIAIFHPNPTLFDEAFRQNILFSIDKGDRYPLHFLIPVLRRSQEGEECLHLIIERLADHPSLFERDENGLNLMTNLLYLQHYRLLKRDNFICIFQLLELDMSKANQLYAPRSIVDHPNKRVLCVNSVIEASEILQVLGKKESNNLKVPIKASVIGLASRYHMASSETKRLLWLFRRLSCAELYEINAVKVLVQYHLHLASSLTLFGLLLNFFLLLFFSLAVLISPESAIFDAADSETVLIFVGLLATLLLKAVIEIVIVSGMESDLKRWVRVANFSGVWLALLVVCWPYNINRVLNTTREILINMTFTCLASNVYQSLFRDVKHISSSF